MQLKKCEWSVRRSRSNIPWAHFVRISERVTFPRRQSRSEALRKYTSRAPITASEDEDAHSTSFYWNQDEIQKWLKTHENETHSESEFTKTEQQQQQQMKREKTVTMAGIKFIANSSLRERCHLEPTLKPTYGCARNKASCSALKIKMSISLNSMNCTRKMKRKGHNSVLVSKFNYLYLFTKKIRTGGERTYYNYTSFPTWIWKKKSMKILW